MDIDSREVLHPKLEVTLHTPPQPAFTATVTEVDENVFWIDLPRDGRQMLVLLANQRINVGVSLKKGLYEAETAVVAVGRDKNKFYCLAIPEKFVLAKERQFARLDYPITVAFRAGQHTANSTLVNISEGGAMVYLVPDLIKIMDSGMEISLHLKLEDNTYAVKVRPAWKKTYDDLPYAGFEFLDMTADFTEALNNLARKYNGS
jgi:c-di-GMP-binding flagellar brake protein YcgR